MEEYRKLLSGVLQSLAELRAEKQHAADIKAAQKYNESRTRFYKKQGAD